MKGKLTSPLEAVFAGRCCVKVLVAGVPIGALAMVNAVPLVEVVQVVAFPKAAFVR